MATIAEKVFGFVLEDKTMHQLVLKELPEEKQKAFAGRKGKIIVEGPEGGIFIVRLTSQGIFRENNDSDLRNEVKLSDSTLMEILTWLAKLPGRKPGLSPRDAYVNGSLRIDGESVLYDAEEIFNALEKHAFNKMQPIAKDAVIEMDRAMGGKRR